MNDIDIINKRLIDKERNVSIIGQRDVFYACATNMERNIISAKFFADHVQRTHPDVTQGSRDNNDCTDVPMNAVILESTIFHSDTNKEVGVKFAKFIYDNYGDADIKASDGNRRIDPALKFYSGIPLMINTNKYLTDTGRANGSLCKGISLILKDKKRIKWKIGMEKS